ncbi:MAG: OmpH family outer membrane protein [Leptospirillia bacterium]
MILVAVFAAIGMSAGFVAAEPGQVGWVNAQRILDETRAGQSIKDRVEAYRASSQQMIDLEESELAALEEKIKTQASLLSEQALHEKEQEFQRKLSQYQKKAMELNKSLQDKKLELLEEFNDTLISAVAVVAGKKGLAFVLDNGSDGTVLYADDSLDVTADVMAQIDGPAQ